jgi:hypothetical protein
VRRVRPTEKLKVSSVFSAEKCRANLRAIVVTDEECESMARVIEPEAWVEYDLGQGFVPTAHFGSAQTPSARLESSSRQATDAVRPRAKLSRRSRL